ncbi:MAG: ApeA N-terminal domain 1-containing protein [Sedimentisphaerales bacterium]
MGSNIKEKYTNMLESFETMGQWWIPGSEKQVSGVLKYDPQEAILELKIIGELLPFKNGSIAQNIKIINGLTVGGQLMTLLNCFTFMCSIRAPGYITIKIIPQFVFAGACFKSEEEMIFKEATYSCYNNEDFMGESGLKSEFQLKDNNISAYNLSYKYPELINFKIEDFDISTNWWINLPGAGPELDIQEKAGFSIKSSQFYKHTDFLDIPIKLIHSFLELIIEDRLPMRTVSLKSEQIDQTGDKESVSLLWKQRISFPLPKRRHQNELNFTIREISNEINNIMQKWNETSQKYKPAQDLFFTVLRMRKELTVENGFLSLCHVLEAYHRIKSDDTYMQPEKYEELLGVIIQTVPKEHKEYIKQRLRYGNELALRKRLNQIYDILPVKIQERIGEKGNFCDKIVNTRNYLTHYDNNIKSLALARSEMIKYETIMIIICKTLFLLDAGIIPETINLKLGNFYIPETISFE